MKYFIIFLFILLFFAIGTFVIGPLVVVAVGAFETSNIVPFILMIFPFILLIAHGIISQFTSLYLEPIEFMGIFFLVMILILGTIVGIFRWKKTKDIKFIIQAESFVFIIIILPIILVKGIALVYLSIILLLGITAGILCWKKTKEIKFILYIESIVLFMLTLPQIIILIVTVFSDSDLLDTLDRLERFASVSNKLEIVELDKSSSFDKLRKDRYNSTVLVKNLPENLDSAKNAMEQFFNKKSQFIDSAYPGNYLGKVAFYEYKRKTAYFINREMLCSDVLFCKPKELRELYPDSKIGYISKQNPCENDSTKYEDIMEIYTDKNRYGKSVKYTLSPECY